jgi:uncharacterized protein YbaR (Trm112 family)
MPLTTERVLVCPQCAGTLEPDTDALNCRGCPLSYPIRDGVPVLVIDQALARPTPTDPEFDRLVADAVTARFSGWDWSWLDNRRITAPDPHGDLADLYDARAPSLVASAAAVLDLGTGGGERLATYGPFPSIGFATEAYPPSVQLARLKIRAARVWPLRQGRERTKARHASTFRRAREGVRGWSPAPPRWGRLVR